MAKKTNNNPISFLDAIKTRAADDLNEIKTTINKEKEKRKKIIDAFFGEEGMSIVGAALVSLHKSAHVKEIPKLRGKGTRENPDYGRSHWSAADILSAIPSDAEIAGIKVNEAIDGDTLFDALAAWNATAKEDESVPNWLLRYKTPGIGDDHFGLNLDLFLSDESQAEEESEELPAEAK